MENSVPNRDELNSYLTVSTSDRNSFVPTLLNEENELYLQLQPLGADLHNKDTKLIREII